MPPSSDQDTNNTSSGSSSVNNKLNHKQSSGGVQIPTKNGKKNGTAKENSGGVLAAVTKNASKLSSNKSSAPTRFQSPKMEPVTSTSNGNPVTSPLLDQLASAALPSSSTQNTNEWAKNVPAYSSSPGNLINLGESPPTLPSSYEDRVANFGGWSTREQRIPHGHNPSASPPTGRRRPLSYQLDGSFQHGGDDHTAQMSSHAGGRRTSLYSQSSRYPGPPLPHQAQPHFYGAPDANLILSPRTPGLTPGENGFYCGFDSLPAQDSSKFPDNVIITGYEGGFSVYIVNKRGLEKIVNVDGLRGGVYSARVIPWMAREDSCKSFPLIAVVVHGPVSVSSDVSSGECAVASSEGNSVRQGESIRGSPRIPQSIHDNDPNLVDYQTSVEIYSLNTTKHIATLLSTPKSPATASNYGQMFVAPPPVGSLTIRADSGNLVVTSGTTGETWIFCQEGHETGQVEFRCIGKVWTTVQQGLSVSPTGTNGSVDGDWHSADTSLTPQKQYKSSILSLSGRWLAYCPSAPSSQISLRAAVPGVPATAKVSGLNAHAPPQLPPVNCVVETPGGESMIGKIAQVTTQEVIKGAAYVGRQGMQAWNNYWNKPAGQQTNVAQAYNLHPPLFPPTHAATSPTPVVNKDPGLISILDLESLAQQNSGTGSLHPLVTFKVPSGCSFLSFSPSGLALFTASSKGDIQFVWDLMRLQYVKSSLLKGSFPGSVSQGPHVRQIARFTRMTIARIVDVVWTKSHGERAAMVTEHGTVHILDLPASAFTWPPPRRKIAARSSKDATSGSEPSGISLSAAGVASNAVTSLWNVAKPLARARRSSSGMTNTTAASVTTQAGHGTQALAANISRSVGAATGKMNELRKHGGKQVRVHLPTSQTPPGPTCVRLVSGKRNDSIIVVGGGIVRIYTIKSRRADRPADKQKASRGAKFVEFRVPSLPDQKVAPDNLSNLHLDDNFDIGDKDTEDLRWKPRQTQTMKPVHSGTESSIPQAEIESNAPYQPFHTDRRVGLHILSYEEAPPLSPSVSALLTPLEGVKASKDTTVKSAWAFGGPINATKLDVGPRPTTEDEYDAPPVHRALPSSAIERILRVTESNEDIDQIVVTTRRRKGASRAGAENRDIDEEGFFEDDCEVLDFASQRV